MNGSVGLALTEKIIRCTVDTEQLEINAYTVQLTKVNSTTNVHSSIHLLILSFIFKIIFSVKSVLWDKKLFA